MFKWQVWIRARSMSLLCLPIHELHPGSITTTMMAKIIEHGGGGPRWSVLKLVDANATTLPTVPPVDGSTIEQVPHGKSKRPTQGKGPSTPGEAWSRLPASHGCT